MTYTGKFIRLKSLDQIRQENIIPIDEGVNSDGEVISVLENDCSSMTPFYGDGKIYYVANSRTHTFRRASDNTVVRSAVCGLRGVEFDSAGRPLTVVFRPTISQCVWHTETFEVVEGLSFYFPYDVGDKVYVNASKIIDYVGVTASFFHEVPCTVLNVDPLEHNLDIKTPDNYTATISVDAVLGLCSEITLPSERTPFYVYRCRKCGNYFASSEYIEDDDDDDDSDRRNPVILCPNCSRRFYITPYHRYAPQFEFWSTNDEPQNDKDLFFGYELEIDGGGERNSTAEYIVRAMNDNPDDPNHPWFMYCSHDGSLSSGMELISAPATMKYHLSQRDKYARLFADLKAKGYLSHNTSTCGLHFHFSRKYFGVSPNSQEIRIARLLYLAERFWDEIVVFSRRDYKSLSHYAKKIDCDPSAFIDQWNFSHDHDGHYYSVNITNPDTIELRMFRGTLNVDTFYATLDFVYTLVHAAKEKTLTELQQLRFEDLLTNPETKQYYATRAIMAKFED